MLNDIFISRFPSIDLHGLDRNMAEVFIKDFINENIKLKNEKIVIIHGIGSGILQQVTKSSLYKNKLVTDYKSSYFNRGITIVTLKI